MRLIDADYFPCNNCRTRNCELPHRCTAFRVWFNNTVDAVPVVRCKDCIYCENRGKYLRCVKRGFTAGHEVKLNDFCSYGERRSDG